MTKFEFSLMLDPLLTAFEKTMSEKLMTLWFDELKSFGEYEIKEAIKKFLDSDSKSFPRIGEFKTAIRGSGERRTPVGIQTLPPSCSRCSHGICCVERFVGLREYSFAFRCTCTAGNKYPDMPLVDYNERTVKEGRMNYTFSEGIL